MIVVHEAIASQAMPESSAANGIPLDDVPDIADGEPFAEEWRAFKQRAQRLVQEGHTGRYALLKGNQLVGVWDSLDAADLQGRQQFKGEPFLVQEIQLFLKPMLWGLNRPCRA